VSPGFFTGRRLPVLIKEESLTLLQETMTRFQGLGLSLVRKSVRKDLLKQTSRSVAARKPEASSIYRVGGRGGGSTEGSGRGFHFTQTNPEK